jgi:hypothetical protein
MSDTPRKWSETAALAAIPFLGYAYAFAFELGFMLHYNLPYWLIRLSLIQVIVTVAAIVIAYMVAMNIAGVLPSGPWRGIVSTMFELVMAIGLLVLLGGHVKLASLVGSYNRRATRALRAPVRDSVSGMAYYQANKVPGRHMARAMVGRSASDRQQESH